MNRIARQAQRTWGDAERCPRSGLWIPESLRGGKGRLVAWNRFGDRAVQYHPRISNPVLQGVEDVINQPIYDTISMAQGAAFPAVSAFFNQIANKTLAQTNMINNGQLAAPQRLFMQAYRIYVGNDAVPADLIAFQRNCSITLTIGNKPYFQGPPYLLSAGCGAIISAAAQLGTAPAGSSPAIATSNGSADQRSIFSLTQPYMMEQGESFYATLRAESPFNLSAAGGNPSGTGLTIAVILDGELYRGVQ